jgi:hypothetical protein
MLKIGTKVKIKRGMSTASQRLHGEVGIIESNSFNTVFGPKRLYYNVAVLHKNIEGFWPEEIIALDDRMPYIARNPKNGPEA